uniref:BZIP domain-containing protein n=1 Tax=Strigamia maritima TaxID=126957 RepID=T1JEZ1_STRMM
KKNSKNHSTIHDDGPLCLVVTKPKFDQFSSSDPAELSAEQFNSTPPGSPSETHFSTPHSRLASPLRVDVQQQGLSASSTHFQEQNSLINSLPLLSSTDFMESPIFARALASGAPKRPRGEKKPIPDEQKDGKYFERRKRNNLAAKKSRDARKSREDQIALRATTLEKENAVLRAQLLTLREEADSLRLLLIQKRSR